MGVLIGLVGIAVFIGAWVAYTSWLTNGIKPRHFTTSVPANELRTIFEAKVARTGWKIVDDGNPMTAQSSLLAGVRQQISLQTETVGDGSVSVTISPARWVTKWGVPKKAHTIRMRMNSFVEATRHRDRSITVVTGELRGR